MQLTDAEIESVAGGMTCDSTQIGVQVYKTTGRVSAATGLDAGQRYCVYGVDMSNGACGPE